MSKVKGQQTEISVYDGSGTSTFEKIIQVRDIGEPGSGDATSIETTDFDSTVKTFTKGLLERGSFSFTVNYDPADSSHTRLDTLDGNSETTTWQVKLSDGTKIEFDGFVTSFPKSPNLDDLVTATCNVQISGDITIS